MSSRFPSPSGPREVAGGLKARSRRGAIAQTWWSARFIEALESLGVANRLARGRAYARRGQVVGLRIEPGAVTASVQGSRVRPYRVRIGLHAFDKAKWNEICQELANNAWYSAKLLAGEMPPDVEDVFASVGLSLFPDSVRELSMDCSCPDWEVPCKHLAAVFYLVAEAFDDDPFAILAWRGRAREELLDAIHAQRAGTVSADLRDEFAAGRPLAESLDSYYALQGALPRLPRSEVPPDALLAQLPATEITVRRMPVLDVLRPVYQRFGVPSAVNGPSRAE